MIRHGDGAGRTRTAQDLLDRLAADPRLTRWDETRFGRPALADRRRLPVPRARSMMWPRWWTLVRRYPDG